MKQRFRTVDSVAVKFTVSGLLHGLIHHALGFPAHIKVCYVTLLHQVRICFCAHCDPYQAGFKMPSYAWDARTLWLII